MHHANYPTFLPEVGFARLPTVEVVSGFRRTWIYDRVNRGEFPAPVKCGAASLWRVEDIRSWLADPAGWRSTTAEVG